MSIFEYDQEAHMRMVRKEGWEEGRADANTELILNMHRNNFTLEQIALATQKSIDEIQAIIEEKEVILVQNPQKHKNYCNRPDQQGFSDFINSTSNSEKAKITCNATLRSLNEKHYRAIKDSDYYWIERTSRNTVEETVGKVERHFGFLSFPENNNIKGESYR